MLSVFTLFIFYFYLVKHAVGRENLDVWRLLLVSRPSLVLCLQFYGVFLEQARLWLCDQPVSGGLGLQRQDSLQRDQAAKGESLGPPLCLTQTRLQFPGRGGTIPVFFSSCLLWGVLDRGQAVLVY